MSTLLSILNRLLGALVVLIILALLSIWAFSPYIVRHYAPEALEPLGLKLLPDSHVRLNPFKAAVSISSLGIAATDHNEAQARIDDAIINVSLLALTRKRLSFDELTFERLELEVTRSESKLQIAGYVIDTSEQPDAEEPEPQQDDSPNALDAWRLEIPSLRIDDFTTRINDQDQPHEIRLESFAVDRLEFAHAGLVGQLALSAKLNEADFESEVQLDFDTQSGSVNFELALEDFNFAPLAYLVSEQVRHLDGMLSFNLLGAFQQSESGLLIELEPSQVALNGITLDTRDVEVRESTLRLDTKALKVSLPNQGELSAEGAFALNGEMLELGPSNTNDVLLAIDALSIPSQRFKLLDGSQFETLVDRVLFENIRFSHPDASTATSLAKEPEQPSEQDSEDSVPSEGQAQLSVNRVKSEENGDDDNNASNDNASPALFQLDQLEISQINARQDALSIESVLLNAFEAHVLVDAQQQISNLVQLAATSTTNNAEGEIAETEQIQTSSQAEGESAEKTESEAPSSFAFALGEFRLTKPSPVEFSYEGMTPPFKQSLLIETLSLEKLDSQKPLEYSKLAFLAKAGEYTSAKIDGELAPFAEQVNLTLDINIKEFELPKISPFIRTAAGFDMANGQLDSATNVAIVNDEISGDAEIEIRGLEIDNAGDVHTGSLTEQTFVPLNVALSALEDSDGRIELDVPLRGNVHSPDFGLNGFLNLVAQRAALAASQSYLINTFVPYANIVTLTTIAGSYALKPRVDDLVFEPKQTELGDPQRTFLDKIAALLLDKESIDMQVCGYAAFNELQLDGQMASAEQTDALRQSALLRANAVKSYLISKHDIASSRVLLCEAKIDQRDDAQPRAEFVF